jgi:hypothetical protein
MQPYLVLSHADFLDSSIQHASLGLISWIDGCVLVQIRQLSSFVGGRPNARRCIILLLFVTQVSRHLNSFGVRTSMIGLQPEVPELSFY